VLRIPCPWCGPRDYNEFRYGGDATKLRPAHGATAAEGAGAEAWHHQVFVFDNPKGLHREYWQHVQGCRHWLVLERNTATNQVGQAWPARDHARKGGKP